MQLTALEMNLVNLATTELKAMKSEAGEGRLEAALQRYHAAMTIVCIAESRTSGLSERATQALQMLSSELSAFVSQLGEQQTTLDLASAAKPTVRAIVKDMAIDELVGCAKDVIAWQDTGRLADGPLHRLATRLEDLPGIDETQSLPQAEAGVLREATLRLVALRTGLRSGQPI